MYRVHKLVSGFKSAGEDVAPLRGAEQLKRALEGTQTFSAGCKIDAGVKEDGKEREGKEKAQPCPWLYFHMYV